MKIHGLRDVVVEVEQYNLDYKGADLIVKAIAWHLSTVFENMTKEQIADVLDTVYKNYAGTGRWSMKENWHPAGWMWSTPNFETDKWKGYMVKNTESITSDLLRAASPGWRIVSKEKNAPKPARKLSKSLAAFGVSLSDACMSEIGKVYGDADPTIDIRFDVTDRFDWHAGEYGEGTGSCWWGEYSNARTVVLPSYGGVAIRTHKQRGGMMRGNGRVWMIPANINELKFSYYEGHTGKKLTKTGIVNRLGVPREELDRALSLGWIGFNSYGPPSELFQRISEMELEAIHGEPFVAIPGVTLEIQYAYTNGQDTTWLVVPKSLTKFVQSFSEHTYVNGSGFYQFYLPYPDDALRNARPQWAKDATDSEYPDDRDDDDYDDDGGYDD